MIVRPTVLRQAGHRNGGGAALAAALGIPHAAPTAYRHTRHSRAIINWGVSVEPNWTAAKGFVYSNTREAVLNCANKLECFNRLIRSKVPCVGATWPGAQYLDGTKDPAWDEKVWLEEDGKIVVRHVLNGHSGAGIQIVRRGEEIPEAPLYTRYFRKHAEYRVHVAFGEAILVQQKRRASDYVAGSIPNDNLVRTHDNGWNFCVNDLQCDVFGYRRPLEGLALQAIEALKAKHGAVDILVRHTANEGTGRELAAQVVCEVNSAPALKSETAINAYAAAFTKWLTEVGCELPQQR